MSKGYIAWGILTEKKQDVIEVHKSMHCAKKVRHHQALYKNDNSSWVGIGGLHTSAQTITYDVVKNLYSISY